MPLSYCWLAHLWGRQPFFQRHPQTSPPSVPRDTKHATLLYVEIWAAAFSMEVPSPSMQPPLPVLLSMWPPPPGSPQRYGSQSTHLIVWLPSEAPRWLPTTQTEPLPQAKVTMRLNILSSI